MSPTGRLTKPQLEGGKQLPEPVNAQLASLTGSFEQVMMPLPDEPVGVGAVWRNSKAIEQNSMKLTAVNTIAITAIDGDMLTYTIDTEIHGDDQQVKQGELAVDMKDVTGTGSGTGTIDLGKLAIKSELAAEFRSEMATPGDEQPTPMRMRSVTKVTPR